MKNFFKNISSRLQQWMRGRYGMDELSKTLNIAALAFLILSMLPWLWFLYGAAFLLWALGIFRCLSRNILKREKERSRYLQLIGRVKKYFTIRRKMWTERKTYKYFRCHICKTTLRIPKGKGTVRIHCPKCSNEIIRKS